MCGGPQPQPNAALQQPVDLPAHASAALAFDPPMGDASPSASAYLDRTGRDPAAFAGFEQTSTSYFDVSTYNREAPDGANYVDRETYIDRSGSVTR